MAPDFSKLTGLSHGYRMHATESTTTIYTEDGAHKFSFDPKVPLWVVHIIADAHRVGMAAAQQAVLTEAG